MKVRDGDRRAINAPKGARARDRAGLGTSVLTAFKSRGTAIPVGTKERSEERTRARPGDNARRSAVIGGVRDPRFATIDAAIRSSIAGNGYLRKD